MTFQTHAYEPRLTAKRPVETAPEQGLLEMERTGIEPVTSGLQSRDVGGGRQRRLAPIARLMRLTGPTFVETPRDSQSRSERV